METFKAIIGLLIIMGVVFLILVGMEYAASYRCSKLYGEGWQSQGFYTIYCTNTKGDVKGFR